ncbi:MAG: tetratricopeptide repeat protein [Cyanothece sp. SIO1E1]|nr:tetratricopeptide repeat protein [Cyanothece sp. SIO1E1]
MSNLTWDSTVSSSDIISSVALLFSIIALIQNYLTSKKENENSRASKRIRAEKLLDVALDLMNGGKTATSLFIDLYKSAEDEERDFFERARRNIKEAMKLAPNFYLCHHYMGIYVHRICGASITERAERALPYYKRAVELWEKDKSPGVKEDGWPYHDLALVYSHLRRHQETEEYYQKAISVNGTTEPYFYADFAEFNLNKGDTEKYKELYQEARRIALNTGRSFDRKNFLDEE